MKSILPAIVKNIFPCITENTIYNTEMEMHSDLNRGDILTVIFPQLFSHFHKFIFKQVFERNG